MTTAMELLRISGKKRNAIEKPPPDDLKDYSLLSNR
jgi:hypothetical protein